MSIGSIYSAKELSQSFQSLLLLEFQFPDGSIYRASTHPLNTTMGNTQWSGVDWDGRVINQDFSNAQAMSDLGVDITPSITVMLADPEKTIYSAWESEIGFKGAILRVYNVLHDFGSSGTGDFSDDLPTPIKFIGTCGPSSSDQGVLTVTAVSLLAFTQKQLPPQRLQQICSWSFPQTDSDRSAALTNPFSIFYQCGYSLGQPGGCGNPDPDSSGGTGAFVSCDLSFQSCVARLGNATATFETRDASKPPIMADQFGNLTGRFGGYQWIPVQELPWTQRNYLTGVWSDVINASNNAKYGDFMPLAYGTTWINPIVMGIYGDGNYTYIEVAICFGQINDIHKVVVNGIEVQKDVGDNQLGNGYRPNDNSINSEATTNVFKNGYWSTINDGRRNGAPSDNAGWFKQGDPYGSVASIFIAVLIQVAPENSIPTVQVLLDGVDVAVYSDPETFTMQFSSNPVWLLMAILVLSGWTVENMDVQTFIDAAAYCDDVINIDSMSGNYQNFYNESGDPPARRFSCGFAVQTRMSFGDLVRGIRANMRGMIYFNFNTGQLSLTIKQTLGDQQPAPIVGSNNVVAIESVSHDGTPNVGYSAYSFDKTNIKKNDGGRSTLMVTQKSSQETPNRTTLQFLNRENSYSQDSLTIEDVEDIQRIGQEITVSMPVIGVQTFDQARRILNNWFAENFRGNGRLDYRGSAIGDTGGTLVFQFETSIKGLHLVVGKIIDITDEQFGFEQQLLRITRVKPSINYETVQITALFHNDNWYQDTYGQSEQPIYAPAQGLTDTPYSWRPGLTPPMPGDAVFDPTNLGFDIFPFYSLAADGTGLASLQITGKIPVNTFPKFLHKPKLELIGQGTTGGGYPSGAYYVAVAEKGAGTIDVGGGITDSQVQNTGSGYAPDDTGTTTGGSGSGATYRVLGPVGTSGGAIYGSIQTPGRGYQVGDVLVAVPGGTQPGSGSGLTFTVLAVDDVEVQGTLGATSPTAIVNLDSSEDALEAVVQAWPGQFSGYVAFAGKHATQLSYQSDGTGTPLVIDLVNDYNEGSWGPPDDAFANHQFKARLVYVSGPFGNILPYEFTPPLVSAPTGSVSASIQLTTYQNYGLTPGQLAGRILTVVGLAVRNGDTSTPIPIANFRIGTNDATTLYLSSGDPTTCVGGGPLVSGDVVVLRFKPTYGSDDLGNYFEDLLLENYSLADVDFVRVIASVSDTTPITVSIDLTDGSPFPFNENDPVVVQGVAGTSSANGRFVAINVDPVAGTLDLAGSSGNGDYLYGGTVGVQVGVGPNTQVGNLAYFVAGTGSGTYAKITSNTKSRFYIDGDWPEEPDETSVLVIAGPDFAVTQPGIALSNSIREFVLTQGFDIQNYDKILMLVQVSAMSKAGKSSLVSLDPIREIFLVGNPLTAPVGVPGSPLFTVRVEEYATLTVNDLAVPENAYDVTEANFLVPSIDDSDVGLWGIGVATTSSVTASLTGGGLNSRLGKTFKTGDYVIWNDPNNYECNFISAIDNNGIPTLVRQDPNAGPGTAFFGSARAAHPPIAGKPVRLYRLEPKIFTGAIAQNMYGTSATPSGLPQQWTWAWPNKVVASVVGQAIGILGNSPLGTVNLGPGVDPVVGVAGRGEQRRGGYVPNNRPLAPGLRTMSGAAYTNLSVSGPLAVGSVAAQRIQVQSWSSIRCVTATLLTPSTTDNVKIHVVWISPDLSTVGLIDTLLILINQNVNYGSADLPQNRQMPYHANGWALPTDWPPNELPLWSGALVGGVLTLPLGLADASPNNPIFGPDGWIDFIVEIPGNAADLTVNVQV